MTQTIGALVVDIEGHELTPEDRDLLAHPLVGGIIFFARNYADRKQLQALCKAIRSCRKTPILIMVDQEGGRVQRFIKEFTRLPAMGVFQQLYVDNAQQAMNMAKDCAWLMAAELLSVGVDLSLAPVLDLNRNLNKVIGDRAFGETPEMVAELAYVFCQGMSEAGMASVGKHFPGHGAVTVDSHAAIPVDTRQYEQIYATDLQPFIQLIKKGIKGILASHILFPEIDQIPAGFSAVWLKDILRQRLGFSGVILTDDLNMQGANISANYAERVQTALNAGCDFALLCNNRAGVIQVVEHLPAASYQVHSDKWQQLAGNFSLAQGAMQSVKWQDTQRLLQNMTQKVF